MTATFIRIWTLFCCLSLPALANPSTNDPAQAEMMRLTQDLSNLAKRQHWQGVERVYERILAISEAAPHYEVHRLAADASKAKGNTRIRKLLLLLLRLRRITAIVVDLLHVTKRELLLSAGVHERLPSMHPVCTTKTKLKQCLTSKQQKFIRNAFQKRNTLM